MQSFLLLGALLGGCRGASTTPPAPSAEPSPSPVIEQMDACGDAMESLTRFIGKLDDSCAKDSDCAAYPVLPGCQGVLVLAKQPDVVEHELFRRKGEVEKTCPKGQACDEQEAHPVCRDRRCRDAVSP